MELDAVHATEPLTPGVRAGRRVGHGALNRSGTIDTTLSNQESLDSSYPTGHLDPRLYTSTLAGFVSHNGGRSLFCGQQYQALSTVLEHLDGSASRSSSPSPGRGSFVVTHELPRLNQSSEDETQYSHSWRLTTLENIEASFQRNHGNKIVFLRGYPQSEWLTRIGARLRLDYEFMFQHYSNPTQLNLSEMFCLPPLSPISTGTIQLTFTSIGSWDNHKSGVSLDKARALLSKDMSNYIKDLNKGQGVSACDTIVRDFHVFDLRHFAIEQKLTIKLNKFSGYWAVLLWSDCGSSLSRTHRGPWLRIRDDHANSVRFLNWPLDFTNKEIKRLMRHTPHGTDEATYEVARDPLEQTLSFLDTELGLTEDGAEAMTSSLYPFFALATIFRLLASSENQFFNLMEEKIKKFNENAERGIPEIQMIKKLVDTHLERLKDVLGVIETRGGRDWPSTYDPQHSDANIGSSETNRQRPGPHQCPSSHDSKSQSQHQKSPISSPDMNFHNAKNRADESAIYLHRTFEKLLRRAQSVSESCRDEMTKLSNESVVREAHRGIEQAESLGKITFIASIFVPLSFTTSIFGMNLQQLNGSGPSVTSWIAVMLPVMVVSLAAWYGNWEHLIKARKLFRLRDVRSDSTVEIL